MKAKALNIKHVFEPKPMPIFLPKLIKLCALFCSFVNVYTLTMYFAFQNMGIVQHFGHLSSYSGSCWIAQSTDIKLNLFFLMPTTFIFHCLIVRFGYLHNSRRSNLPFIEWIETLYEYCLDVADRTCIMHIAQMHNVLKVNKNLHNNNG